MKFIVDGAPVGKARARTVHKNGVTRTYTPSKTKAYEAYVKNAFMKQLGADAKIPMPIPIKVVIRANYEVPTSDTIKHRERCLDNIELPVKKPDADNIAKIILDALNGVAWEDDRQVTTLVVEKWYRLTARVEIEVTEER